MFDIKRYGLQIVSLVEYSEAHDNPLVLFRRT